MMQIVVVMIDKVLRVYHWTDISKGHEWGDNFGVAGEYVSGSRAGVFGSHPTLAKDSESGGYKGAGSQYRELICICLDVESSLH